MSGKLFVVGTPIGNLGDFSPRAAQTLADVDFIAAEDTRVTVKLLNHFEIKKPMVSYYEHNKASKSEHIISRILEGENCALVTDAGMPAISDPGIDLVALCHQYNIEVVSVPGPSAIITAAAISGMDVSRFTFEGFLSMNKPKRREHLADIVNEKRTMIFYEAPHKLPATLKDFLEYLGDRKIALVKELTKIHENVELTTLSEACEKYSQTPPKGEFVVIIEGKKTEDVVFDETDGIALAKRFLSEGMSLSEAAKRAAKETGIKKGDIYKALTEEDR
ncbi:MAG: 16S rRNA (cytidine(1402)-2'-O)-methyltransferase [Clostridia bacterium]|nr:16S rRNA (cytidine(1402)-2'-O)-methyltransferase [Clostridia bacterium]